MFTSHLVTTPESECRSRVENTAVIPPNDPQIRSAQNRS